MFKIETERLIITEFTPDMAEKVHLNSLDADNRRFVPDEVFETLKEARDAVQTLIACYSGEDGPFVYPVLRKNDGANMGYVQLVPLDEGWEIGYHIAAPYTRQGYASEAVHAFLPVMMARLGLEQVMGVCLADNASSRRVMAKCGFRPVFEGVGMYQGMERPICRMIYP